MKLRALNYVSFRVCMWYYNRSINPLSNPSYNPISISSSMSNCLTTASIASLLVFGAVPFKRNNDCGL